MIAFPIAKINLGLRITSKRPDGYHDIETIFYPLEFCDALEFVISDNPDKVDSLTSSGISTGSSAADNLIMKALVKLREKHTLPALKIHLHKAIPVGAGLGGGSSDSACIMKAVNKSFRLNISEDSLRELSLELGSDCPFFLDCVPSYATGRGEVMQNISPVLKGYYLVLLNPSVAINTSEAYQNCKPAQPSRNLLELIQYPVDEWKDVIVNDFEEFAFRKHPVIGEIKSELYNNGALFSLMSGSGSSVYGIFKEKPKLSGRLKEFIIFQGVV